MNIENIQIENSKIEIMETDRRVPTLRRGPGGPKANHTIVTIIITIITTTTTTILIIIIICYYYYY